MKGFARVFFGFALACVVMMPVSALAGGDTVKGSFTANDVKVELNHVYVYAKEHPFDEARKAYTFCLTDKPVPYEELENMWTIDDLTYVEVSVGDDKSPVGQNLSHTNLEKSNISGSAKSVEFTTFEPPHFAGRFFMTEPDEFFGDVYVFDASFTVTIPPPKAPTGKPLPEGGGEPGAFYKKYLKAVASGDIEQLRPFVPPEAADEFGGPDTAEIFEMMQMMTPKDAKILSGTIDGEIAVLQVEAKMDDEIAHGEITMMKMGKVWTPKKTKWKQ